MFEKYNEEEEKEARDFYMKSIIKDIKKYAPKKVNLPEFDEARKNDYIYCIEWGMKKAQRNEYLVYKKMLKELKNK